MLPPTSVGIMSVSNSRKGPTSSVSRIKMSGGQMPQKILLPSRTSSVALVVLEESKACPPETRIFADRSAVSVTVTGVRTGSVGEVTSQTS